MPVPLSTAVAVSLGGAVGALARVGLGEAVASDAGAWPWGTLLANLAGTALLAALVGALVRLPASGRLAPAIGGGLCGALTTFSALQVEAIRLGAESGPLAGVGYGAVSLVGGLALAFGVLALTRRVLQVSG